MVALEAYGRLRCSRRWALPAAAALLCSVGGVAGTRHQTWESLATDFGPFGPRDAANLLKAVKPLANHDGQLGTRTLRKNALCAGDNVCGKAGNVTGQVVTKAEWIDQVRRGKESGGYEAWGCGLTLGYVYEVFSGLDNAWEQYRDGMGLVGYQSIDTESALLAHFRSFASSPVTVLHQFQVVGTSDHVWAVEQLPHGAGFRIYQSYHEAYSLKAWLTASEGELDALLNTDVTNWKVKEHVEAFLASMGLSWDTLDRVPDVTVRNYMAFVRDYNEHTALAFVKRAWKTYGGGRVVSPKVFFGRYLPTVGSLLESMLIAEAGDFAWTQKQHDDWIDFSGGMNPVQYPGMKFSTVAHQGVQFTTLGPTKLVIKSVADVGFDYAKNADIIRESL